MLSHPALFEILPRMSLQAMSPRRLAVLFMFGLMIGSLSVWAISAYLVLPSMRTYGRCPFCQSTRIRSAWPRFSDRLLLWLRAFRCEACLRRYYVLKREPRRRHQRAASHS